MITSGNPTPLKYLFTVEYLDGSIFEQNAQDVSLQDPLRSAFFDVKQDQVKRFSISDFTDTYLVDLTDGHFEVNGKPFWLHDQELSNFRLIFFRRHKHFLNQDVEFQEGKWQDKGKARDAGHMIIYRIGWQANDKKGKNFQEVLQVL